jgi:hypothetical protein
LRAVAQIGSEVKALHRADYLVAAGSWRTNAREPSRRNIAYCSCDRSITRQGSGAPIALP